MAHMVFDQAFQNDFIRQTLMPDVPRDARTLLELEKLRMAREKEQARTARADAHAGRAAATHRKQCERVRLRHRWATEDVARLAGRARVAAQRRVKRAQEAMTVECPA